MSHLTMRRSKHSDADWIVERLTPEDRASIEAEGEAHPKEAIRRSMKHSMPCSFTACEKIGGFENPVALFGVVPMVLPASSKKAAQVWCVATNPVRDRHWLSFSTGSKRWLDTVMKSFDVIYNYEDARAETHLRWLKFCGFEFLRTQKYGPKDMDFVVFARFA